VLEKAVADLRQYYFNQDVAQKTVNALLAHEQAGDYNAITNDQAFAKLLARHLIDAAGRDEAAGCAVMLKVNMSRTKAVQRLRTT
jgi:hypothetical protein